MRACSVVLRIICTAKHKVLNDEEVYKGCKDRKRWRFRLLVNMENIAYIHDLQDVRKIHLANGEEITTLMDVDYLLSTSQS